MERNGTRLASLVFMGWLVAAVHAAAPTTIKVFVLAGQSNMEGQAVVDLSGNDYNQGKGTLESLFADAGAKPLVAHLKDATGAWRRRDDVWVRYQPEDKSLQAGPLALGFTPYLDQHHFGPELQFGHVVGDAFEDRVLLVKTAWGGKSLYVDFRPPSSGGATGPYYTLMVSQIRQAMADVAKEFPEACDAKCELAGLVWYQGWNDGCDPKKAVPEYERNLVNLIKDVRQEFQSPRLPVVVGELTGPWIDAPREWDALRKAQAAAAASPELGGSVRFVPTHDFVRPAAESPNPGHGHHEFGNAETYFLVGDALGKAMVSMVTGKPAAATSRFPARTADAAGATESAKNAKKPRTDKKNAKTTPSIAEMKPGETRTGEMAGYLLVATEKVPEQFNAGFSLYAAAWPLLKQYPGHRFQTGLFGTWMHAQYEGKPPADLYSDIEGGLGWWRDTRFPTETPKFIMGGVAVNFKEIANGPAHGAGSWDAPRGLYGVAQLSPWIVFPLDGLNLKQGTCGELFGYGYLPLPFTEPKATTGGTSVATGDQCWTLFLNTANFKGPVCFFTPYFWSHSAQLNPAYAGLLLDSRPAAPNKPFQMETQYVPAQFARAASGETFARVASTRFPVDADGKTVVLHRLTSYTRAAMWDGVKAWFAGGEPVSGSVNPAGEFVQQFKSAGGSTWQIYPEGTAKGDKVPMAWKSLATPVAIDPTTYGYTWDQNLVTRVRSPRGDLVMLPEYYRLEQGEKKSEWVPAKAAEVPGATKLAQAKFQPPREEPQPAYDTPQASESAWKRPGPVAGPFTVKLGDGSLLTYSWYRFADQPALQHADLTPEERERMQARAEKLHRAWTKDRDYLAPPTVGRLADLDPAQLVQPPKGLEIGYVPIATRQEVPGRETGATSGPTQR